MLTAMWRNGAARNVSVGARPQTELLDFVKQRASKRAVISFLPRKWASWDHGKLAAATY